MIRLSRCGINVYANISKYILRTSVNNVVDRKFQFTLINNYHIASKSILKNDTSKFVIKTTTRLMNRNARRPKKPNHGKRPCSHARRRAKAKTIKSRAERVKIFGFW